MFLKLALYACVRTSTAAFLDRAIRLFSSHLFLCAGVKVELWFIFASEENNQE